MSYHVRSRPDVQGYKINKYPDFSMKALSWSAVTPHFFLLSISLISYSSSDFPLSFLVSHVSGSTCETCRFNACLMLFPSISLAFVHFQCYADSAVPSVQKKLGLIYFQLRNYEPKCHNSMILTSFAGLGS